MTANIRLLSEEIKFFSVICLLFLHRHSERLKQYGSRVVVVVQRQANEGDSKKITDVVNCARGRLYVYGY